MLALDTSTDTGLVVLVHDHKTYARVQKEPREHNRFLLAMIEDIVLEAGIGLNDLDAIVCGVGPGSFVGVRLGVAVAQGLAYGLDKPVYALNSLALQAQAYYRHHPENKDLMIAHDARMRAFYYAHYHYSNGLALCVGEAAFIRLADGFNKPVNKESIIVGNAANLLAEISGGEIAYQGIPELGAEDLIMQAGHVLATQKPVTPAELQPVYLGDEVNWKKADDTNSTLKSD